MIIPKIEPSPEIKKMLETWRQPSFAYVLFETTVRNYSKDESGNFPPDPKLQKSTFTLNVEGRSLIFICVKGIRFPLGKLSKSNRS